MGFFGFLFVGQMHLAKKEKNRFSKKIMVNLESFPPAVPYVEFHEILQKGKERRGGPEMMAALAP